MNGFTRRDWMGMTVIPAAAVRGSAANSSFTAGLIGAGARGSYLANVLNADGRARIVALCDIFDDRIEAARTRIPAPGAKAYKDYRDLLASGVDAVIIATPVHVHPEQFEAAVRAGKHIYFEKPAAVDVAGCKRIMRAADSAPKNLTITVGFQRRAGQVFLKAKSALDSGAIGQLRMAHSRWLKGIRDIGRPAGPRPTTPEGLVREWRWWRDTSGDALTETFIHGVDVLNWFIGGRPEKAAGSGGRAVIRHGDTLDHVNVTFTYPSGIQASLFGSFMAPTFYRSVKEEFFGETGIIETSETHWSRQHSSSGIVTEKSPRNIVIDAVEAFVRRVVEGKPENNGVEGVLSTLTCLMGQMAIDLRREVTWEEMMSTG